MEFLRCPEKYCFNLLWTDLVHGQDFVRPGGDVSDCSCGRRQARCCCQGCAPYFITNRNMIFCEKDSVLNFRNKKMQKKGCLPFHASSQKPRLGCSALCPSSQHLKWTFVGCKPASVIMKL